MSRSPHAPLGEEFAVEQMDGEISGKTLNLLSRLPSFYGADDLNSLFFQLLNGWGQVIEQTEIDLFKVMQSHHVSTANNEGSQGFNTNQQGDLDRLFSLYIEALGGTSLLTQIEGGNYAPYRDRLLALIGVLRRGAATKQGIQDIVAANLGIFSDNPEAQAAKAKIQIEEYLPELISYFFSIHPFSPDPTPPAQSALQLPQTFEIVNPNVLPVAPGFKLEVQDIRRPTGETFLPPLIHPRFVNLETQESFEIPIMLKVGDVLRIQPSGTLLLNGVEQSIRAIPPPLPLGTSRWSLEFKVGEVVGQYDQTLYDFSRYEQVETPPPLLNRGQAANYGIALNVEITKITPGTFRVRIPWDIPGFTDKFSDRQDHPRSQIAAIINRVKAAGVMAVIDYESRYAEDHRMDDRLIIRKTPAPSTQGTEEIAFDSSKPASTS